MAGSATMAAASTRTAASTACVTRASMSLGMERTVKVMAAAKVAPPPLHFSSQSLEQDRTRCQVKGQTVQCVAHISVWKASLNFHPVLATICMCQIAFIHASSCEFLQLPGGDEAFVGCTIPSYFYAIKTCILCSFIQNKKTKQQWTAFTSTPSIVACNLFV